MAEHIEYLELISAALDGALSPAEQAKLDAHLAACPDCRALAEDLKALHEGLSALPAAEPPAGLHDRIMSAVAADNVTPFAPKKLTHPWKRWGACAAAVAIILAGAYGMRGRFAISGDSSGAAPRAAAPASAESAEDAGSIFSASGAPESVDEPAETGLPALRSASVGGGNGLASQSGTDGTDGDAAGYSVTTTQDLSGAGNETGAYMDKKNNVYGNDDLASGQSLDEAPEEVPASAAPRIAMFSAQSPGAPEAPESTEKAELTAREALDVLLDKYPMREDAELVDTEEFLGWQTPLLPLDPDNGPDGQQASTRLEYLRVTPNGKYHEFWLYTFLLDLPSEGLAHSSTLNFFAVPLDGGEILAARQVEGGLWDEAAWETCQADIDAYGEAITN